MFRAVASLFVVISLTAFGGGCETLKAAFAPKAPHVAQPTEPLSSSGSTARKAPAKKKRGKKGAPAPADEPEAPPVATPPVVAEAPPPPPPVEAPPAPAVEGHVSALTRKAVLSGAGELTRDELKEAVNLGLAAIDRCYDDGLRTQAALSGKLTLAFSIDDAGNVSSARARTSTLQDDGVVACVVEQVRGWHFPAPRGGAPVDVELPLVFETR